MRGNRAVKVIVTFALILSIVWLSSTSSAEIDIHGEQTERLINIADKINTFLGLDDTPDSYAGFTGQCVAVNSGGTALIFQNCTNASMGGSSSGGIDSANLNITYYRFFNTSLDLVNRNDNHTRSDTYLDNVEAIFGNSPDLVIDSDGTQGIVDGNAIIGSSGDTLGWFGTARNTDNYNTVNIVQTATSPVKYYSATFDYRPPFSVAPSISVLDFIAINRGPTVSLTEATKTTAVRGHDTFGDTKAYVSKVGGVANTNYSAAQKFEFYSTNYEVAGNWTANPEVTIYGFRMANLSAIFGNRTRAYGIFTETGESRIFNLSVFSSLKLNGNDVCLNNSQNCLVNNTAINVTTGQKFVLGMGNALGGTANQGSGIGSGVPLLMGDTPMNVNKGFVAMRKGSVTGISSNVDVTTLTGGDLLLVVLLNETVRWQRNISRGTGDDQRDFFIEEPTNNSFVAGDTIRVEYNFQGILGSIAVNEAVVTLEIEYD